MTVLFIIDGEVTNMYDNAQWRLSLIHNLCVTRLIVLLRSYNFGCFVDRFVWFLASYSELDFYWWMETLIYCFCINFQFMSVAHNFMICLFSYFIIRWVIYSLDQIIVKSLSSIFKVFYSKIYFEHSFAANT